MTLGRTLPLLACALGACKEPEAGVTSPWQVAAVDMGAPKATGASLSIQNGDGLWSPLSQVVPFLEYDDPASDVPFFLWDLATSDRVADMGSCPDVQAVGRTTTWETYGCRSSQGYEWTGDVSQEEWDDDARGWRYARWDFDLDVVADIEDPRFDALSLHGSVLYVIGDGAVLDHSVQVNMAVGLDGYWARQSPSDDREDLWNDWIVTARYEEAPTDTYRIDGAADLGSAGAFSFSSESLKRATTCPAVPDGTLTIDGEQSAALTFSGSTACSSCADLEVAGGAGGRACRD